MARQTLLDKNSVLRAKHAAIAEQLGALARLDLVQQRKRWFMGVDNIRRTFHRAEADFPRELQVLDQCCNAILGGRACFAGVLRCACSTGNHDTFIGPSVVPSVQSPSCWSRSAVTVDLLRCDKHVWSALRHQKHGGFLCEPGKPALSPCSCQPDTVASTIETCLCLLCACLPSNCIHEKSQYY